jgi:hypothetical protein
MNTVAAGTKTRTKRWPVAGVSIALAGLAAFGAYKYWKPRDPARSEGQLPFFTKAQEQQMREGLRQVGRTLLGLTPDQEKKMQAIWQRFPTTVDELVDHTKRTDEVLTETQRAIVKPIRTMARHQAIDRMLEPARSRFPPEDFEKFKKVIKERVDQRIGR